MFDDEDGIDDAITRAFLGDSTYERVRLQRPGIFGQSIPTKLLWQSTLLFGLGALPLVVAAFPASVQRTVPTTDPLTGTPKVALLGLVGGVAVLLGGLGLTAVAAVRLRLGSAMTEEQAHSLLGIEEVASLVGLGSGGFAVLLTIAFSLVGLGGTAALEAYVAEMGRSPFAPSGVGMTVGHVGAFGLLAGTVLLGVSRYFRARLTDDAVDDG